MALWTPYNQEVALDLTKSSVKVERTSPMAARSAPQSPTERYVHCATETNIQHYAGFQLMNTHMYVSSQLYESERTFTPLCSAQPLYLEPQQHIQYFHEPVICYDVPSKSPDSSESARRSNGPSPPQLDYDSLDTESLSEDPEYAAFERDAFQALAEKNGGTLLGHNPRMRRAVNNTQVADDTYRKQRNRNNCAAKQSRDRRKLRELRLAFQVSFLKKKMTELRVSRATGLCRRCSQL